MDDSTRTGGTVVALYSSNDVRRDSPHSIRGTLKTFVDGRYYDGVGKYKTEAPNREHYVVVDVRAGQRRWENGQIVEFVTEINGHYPQRHELGHTDQRAWGPGPGGKPADPWQDAREALLLREVDFSEYTLAIATGGGRAAIDSLARSMQNADLLRPGQFPVVELAWQPMHTAWGTKAKPDLRIVGWWQPQTPSIAPPDDPAA